MRGLRFAPRRAARRMPYEEVGSAARGWAQNRAQAAGQQAGGGGGGYAPGRAGRSPSTVAAMLVLPFLVGVVSAVTFSIFYGTFRTESPMCTHREIRG